MTLFICQISQARNLIREAILGHVRLLLPRDGVSITGVAAVVLIGAPLSFFWGMNHALILLFIAQREPGL